VLSRLAESYFWLGRYLERAEATTRLLAEHHQLMVEDQSVSETLACAVLLEALTLPHEEVTNADDLVRSVVGNEENPSTIIGAVSAARENARAVRDSLSAETFEALNTAYLSFVRGVVITSSPGVTLHRLMDRLLMVNGVIDWTMPRDEAYHFLVLGRELERIDMVGRLLAVRHDQLWPSAGPSATLRAAGAQTAFLRSGAALVGSQVRAYLVLDPVFPRSMRNCATDAEEGVRALGRLGVRDRGALLREVGMLRSALEFEIDDDPVSVDRLADQARQAAHRASDQVNATFFRQHGTIVWSH
jgi:uncharacterized alpha-E superfamily protein